MRHCITCDASYAEGEPHRCPSCENRTLNDDELALWKGERAALTEEHFVPVRVIDGPVDEVFLREMLKESGMTHEIISHQQDALSSAYQGGKGYGMVLVPEAIAEQARTFLAELAEAEPIEEIPNP